MSSIAPAAAPKNEQEILSTYRQMQSEMQGLIQNLTKVEMERNEHRYVFPITWVYPEFECVSAVNGEGAVRMGVAAIIKRRKACPGSSRVVADESIFAIGGNAWNYHSLNILPWRRIRALSCSYLLL